jgi:hypothetical protein
VVVRLFGVRSRSRSRFSGWWSSSLIPPSLAGYSDRLLVGALEGDRHKKLVTPSAQRAAVGHLQHLAELVAPPHLTHNHAGPYLARRSPSTGGAGGTNQRWPRSRCQRCGACSRSPCHCPSAPVVSGEPGRSGAVRRAQCWQAQRWQAQRCHYRHRSWPQYAGPNPFDTSSLW